MSKIRNVVLLLVLMFVSGVSFGAVVSFTNATGNRLWTDPNNWDMGGLSNPLPDQNSNWVVMGEIGPVIADGMACEATSIRCGTSSGDGTIMEMTGGTLDMNDWFMTGTDDPSSYGEFYMSGGVITTEKDFWVGYMGEGHVYMSGGVINCHNFDIDVQGTPAAGLSTMDMTGGMIIIISTDQTINVQKMIDDEQLTAFGGDGVIVYEFNTPEYPNSTIVYPVTEKPNNPDPEDGAVGVALDKMLSWSGPTSLGDDPNYVYDVYFGTAGNMTFVGNVSETIYDPASDFTVGTEYEWQIAVIDPNEGGTPVLVSTGPVWSFTSWFPTVDLVSPAPSTVSDVPIDAICEWTADAGADSYDVYFGTENPPTTLIQNQTGTTFDPDLDWATTYYWRIDVVAGGAAYPGDVWRFTTIVPVCEITAAEGDINGDCVIDLNDFASVAANWLVCGWNPAESYCP